MVSNHLEQGEQTWAWFCFAVIYVCLTLPAPPSLPPPAFITTLLYDAIVDLWVGLTSDAKGHFQWARPGLLSYTNWAPGEPLDNSGPHHNRTPVRSLSPSTRVLPVSCFSGLTSSWSGLRATAW